MKRRLFALTLLALTFAPHGSVAAESKSPASPGQWLKIPDTFMISRFVQSQKAQHATYRVALVVPPAVAPRA